MLTILIISGIALSFAVGTATGALVVRRQVRSQDYFARAIEAAETRGRIEAMMGKPVRPGMEPPRPLL